MAFIKQPKNMNPLFKSVIRVVEKAIGKRLEAARLLTWYPKAALGAGVMEGLIAHDVGKANKRLLKLVRMQVSFDNSCAFCIDMNSKDFDREDISDEEIMAIQGRIDIEKVMSFSKEELLALQYARELTATPIALNRKTVARMQKTFSEREIVVIASTVGQVCFWTKTIQGLGIKPAGFTESCSTLKLDDYKTLK